MVNLRGGPVELDDQERLDVERIARVDEYLRGMNRGAVHHFHASGDDAGADDLGDALARLFRGRESDQHRARGLRPLEDATVTSVTTPSKPSEPVITPRRS